MSNAQSRLQSLYSFSVGVFILAQIVSFLFPSSGCRAAERIATHWVSQSVQVDGDGSDWENYPIKFFRDQEISVGLANDSANLYVMLRFRDPQWMRTIHMTGLNLYFDNEGGKKKRYTLTYRGGPDPSQLRGLDSLDQGPRRRDGEEMSDDMRSRMEVRMKEHQGQEFVVAIDKEIFDKEIPTDGSQGPRAATRHDAGFFTYEFSVPLSQKEVQFYGIDSAPGKKIGIGLVWGDMSEVKQGMRDGGPGGGGPGGGMGGGPPGGGMGGPRGGGMGGPPGDSDRSIPRKQEIWIKSELATVAKGNTAK